MRLLSRAVGWLALIGLTGVAVLAVDVLSQSSTEVSNAITILFYAVIVGIPVLVIWANIKARAARNRSPHDCPECGYDLRATPGRCPECGKGVSKRV